jgi:hypothetical protein
VEAAVVALEGCRLEGTKLTAKQAELERLGKEVRAAGAGGEEARPGGQGEGPALPGDNPRFPTFSDAVTIRYEEGRGRFAVAARDIRPGELIARETAYVSLLDREWSKSHCWHCLTCTKSPLPCPACSGVQYCSRGCRDTASSTYHKYECLYTDSLYKAQMGAWHLAYRALTMRPGADYKADLPAFLARDERAGEQGEAVYSSQDVASFHSLVSHDGGSKQAPALMMQCHVVVFLLRLLRATGYTEPGPGLELTEEEVLAGRLLHHFMRAAYYNTHEITEVEKTGDGWVDNRARRVGRVTNPSLALINHSCDPNYSRVSHGVTTYGFACRPIGKGQEILDTYCKPVAAAPREERHKHLEKYNFTCGCPACRGNWPTLAGMHSDFSGLPPAMYRQPANSVEASVKRIPRSEEPVHKAERQGGGVVEVAARLAALVEEVHKLVRGPHHAIAYWESQLHQVGAPAALPGPHLPLLHLPGLHLPAGPAAPARRQGDLHHLRALRGHLAPHTLGCPVLYCAQIQIHQSIFFLQGPVLQRTAPPAHALHCTALHWPPHLVTAPLHQALSLASPQPSSTRACWNQQSWYQSGPKGSWRRPIPRSHPDNPHTL